MALPMHRTSRSGSGIQVSEWKESAPPSGRRPFRQSSLRESEATRQSSLDCFAALAMTGRDMRRYLALSLALLLAACATAPRQAPPTPQPAPVAEAPSAPSELRGLTANELVGHFGMPALQIREGTSLKLQFRGRRCVLDAYLYPQTGGALRVTHVDTRS